MGKIGACRWCRTGRYHSDPRKHFRESHLCYHCMITCGLIVKHLAPASERRSKHADSFGGAGYYKPIPFESRLGILAKSASIKAKLKANYVDPDHAKSTE